MNKLFFFLFFICALYSKSQVYVTNIVTTQGKCVDVKDGVLTFSVVNATTPFTCTVLHHSLCVPLNTLVVSNQNTVSITGFPGCQTIYTIEISTASNSLATTFFCPFIVNSANPFLIGTGSFTPASCSNCCDGAIYPTWSGGSFPSNNTPLFYLNGMYLASYFYPITGVCPGTNTLCAKDQQTCEKCITFVMAHGVTGLTNKKTESFYSISPNPFNSEITVFFSDEEFAPSEIEIVDATGKKIFCDFKSFINSNSIIISNLNIVAGVYLLRISNSCGMSRNFRIIKIE